MRANSCLQRPAVVGLGVAARRVRVPSCRAPVDLPTNRAVSLLMIGHHRRFDVRIADDGQKWLFVRCVVVLVINETGVVIHVAVRDAG